MSHRRMFYVFFLLAALMAAQSTDTAQLLGPQNAQLDQIVTIRATAEGQASDTVLPVEALAPEALPSYQEAEDGRSFVLLRFVSEGAAGLRLRFEDVNLPEGARLFVYALDQSGAVRTASGPYTGAGPTESGEFWSAAFPGDQVIVEMQVSGEVPGDLPFRVVEIARLDEESLAGFGGGDEPAAGAGGWGYSMFRGAPLLHEIRNGMAIFEGDILLGRAEELEPATPSKAAHRVRESIAITGSRYRWPGGVVPYVVDSAIPNAYRVTDAVRHWNEKLAGVIRLVPRTTESNYVKYTYSSDASLCASYVGMLGYGMQPIYVGNYCSTGNLIHETGHTIGLWHEQSREDRDRYVKILWANIKPGTEYNFSQNVSNGDDIGAYDYGSIMHYGATSFSVNGKPTIETIPPGIAIGQRSGLSAGDMAGVRQIYGGTTAPPPVTSITATVSANPSAASVSVDNVSYSGARSFRWTVGSAHTLKAATQSGSSTRYAFVNWSDGGAATHTVTAPSTAVAYTAYFRQQSLVTAVPSPSTAGRVVLTPASGDGYYDLGTPLGLNAQPNAGYCFTGWTGLVGGTPPQTTLVVTKPYSLKANFVAGGITVSPTLVQAPASGGSVRLNVKITSGCYWTASTTANWIALSVLKYSSTSGVVALQLSPNTGASRSAAINVGNLTVTVVQAGAAK